MWYKLSINILIIAFTISGFFKWNVKIQIKSVLMFMFPTLLFLAGNIHSQASVNAAGSDAKGPGGSLSYSIGQATYTTNAGLSGTAAQGVQHAYEVYAVSTNESTPDMYVSVYPNPASEELTLRIEDFQTQIFSFNLIDSQGKSLQINRIHEQNTYIDMSSHPASTYFLHVISKQHNKTKTFKIIKN
jgi:hypothetical protein